MNDDEIRKLAKQRLKDKLDFKRFLWIWLALSIFLVAIWGIPLLATGTPTYFWPAWPIGGLAIAAFFIGLNAYGPHNGLITEEKIDAEVRRIKGTPG